MSGSEAGSRTSLLDMSDLRAEDGSPLPLVGNMCRVAKLQSLPPLLDLHNIVLLRLLWSFCGLGLEGDTERRGIHGVADAC